MGVSLGFSLIMLMLPLGVLLEGSGNSWKCELGF